ncbi:MAG TPA: TIM44-like domain-containing protein [Pyrinomonadaceae bacterium]|nr:TIM44-like domain-containing protein [Pyrinomonadaceae bacterium]
MNHRRFPISNFRLRVRVVIAGVVLFGVALFETEAVARVGGGQSYGGGGGHGGGGGGAGALVYLLIRFLLWLTIEHPVIGIPVDIIVIALVIYWFTRPSKKTLAATSSPILAAASGGAAPGGQQDVQRSFNQLRRFDPNFSEIIFTDFCYALYGRAHDARGHDAKALDLLSPYLSDQARASLAQLNPPTLKAVEGIIVGAMEVIDVRGLATPTVGISVGFEANYTEFTPREGDPRGEMSYYVRERWELERKRDVLSPPPEQATALHCPRCGAPLQKDTAGACAFCGTKIDSGEFQWYVRSITPLSREAKGPLLTSDVPEVGTDYPTVTQPNFPAVRAAFEQNNPSFSWADFQARARLIFNELQEAWSTLNWERARPHETDNIFQMHRYWIDAYKRQGLRNALDQCQITAMQSVKIKEDAFYHAITLRIFAQGYDYTIANNGHVVAGSNKNLRRWSEYWTFIRNSKAKPAPARADLNCPNCGAPLKVNATGICEFCKGKITSGEFDWVLSKIEQDESYAG